MSHLYQLREACIERDKEWARNQSGEGVELSLSFRGCELGGECGELLNLLKKVERERLGLRGSRAQKSHIEQEVGDVLICLDNICMKLGIDLWEATKNSFNRKSHEMGFETILGKGEQ